MAGSLNRKGKMNRDGPRASTQLLNSHSLEPGLQCLEGRQDRQWRRKSPTSSGPGPGALIPRIPR